MASSSSTKIIKTEEFFSLRSLSVVPVASLCWAASLPMSAVEGTEH